MPRILIIADEPELQALIGRALDAEGHEILLAQDTRRGLRLVEEREPDLVIVDERLASRQGYGELVNRLRVRSDLPVLVISAGTAQEEAERVGSSASPLTRPFTIEELIERVEGLLSDPV